ncbi:DNA polymerase III subunit gamma/tau [Alicyclobacillus sp.]|uniref:DNA polymerase III subunit gamma/tau n=1 Tax=Alicyclobacillus sp. TaxID=61169 RepID=UPI0025BB0B0D|nr:DNA polymerase III subunit gamma/tau [Alicyclobacillus sp.]MCL6516600.1 DNA polymerase III subunit gamma/tau [Alicyclobacillus sp.]
MPYQALYRAWRPQTFADLVGQPHVKQTLMNAILRGHVAHAYLFSGPRGTGKTSAAKVLAKAVNCTDRRGAEPCNQCEACRSITAGTSVDVEEIDAASNRGVEEIRTLRDKVQYAPASLARKVYIVDEVHMLTTEAFNALLKTLEEPPGHTLFVLATTEPHKIPGTIVSRCQRFDFRRIEPEQILDRLRTVCEDQGWRYEDEALWAIAEAADGGLRDALGLLEQVAAFGAGDLTADQAAQVLGGVRTSALLTLIERLVQEDLLGVIEQLMDWYASGKDASRIVHDLLQVLRDLFIVKLSSRGELATRPGYRETAERCDRAWLLRAIQSLGETYVHLRFVDQPRLALETALLSLAPSLVAGAAATTAGGRAVPVSGSPPAAAPMGTAPAGGVAAGMSAGGVSAAAATRVASTTPPAAAPAQPAAALRAVAASKTPAGAAPAVAAQAAEATPPTAAAPPAGRAPARRTSATRKMEVLTALVQQASEETLEAIRRHWEPFLQRVQERRIQTHAWLTNGEPVLATPDTLVLAFTSQVHRNSVMKPEDRAVIEAALAEEMGAPIQVLALLRADWEAFQQIQAPAVEQGVSEQAAARDADDWVAAVVRVFGADRVEIIEDEE